jgi:hypothetical protein
MAHRIGPNNGNVGAAAIRQNQYEMRFSFVPQPGEDVEHLAFQGMVRTRHPYLGWQVLEVGSLS